MSVILSERSLRLSSESASQFAQARRSEPPAYHVYTISPHSTSPGVSEHALDCRWLLGAGARQILEDRPLSRSAVWFLHCCNGGLSTATAFIPHTWSRCGRSWSEQVCYNACSIRLPSLPLPCESTVTVFFGRNLITYLFLYGFSSACRVYGGLHFRKSIEDGLRVGYDVSIPSPLQLNSLLS